MSIIRPKIDKGEPTGCDGDFNPFLEPQEDKDFSLYYTYLELLELGYTKEEAKNDLGIEDENVFQRVRNNFLKKCHYTKDMLKYEK